MSTKIEWCDETWNPVWGCWGGCEYCYARRMAKRMAGNVVGKAVADGKITAEKGLILVDRMQRFEPTVLPWKSNPTFKKSSKIIFVNSMSDIACWRADDIANLGNVVALDPLRQYVTLTKYSSAYSQMRYEYPNLICGITNETGRFGVLQYEPHFTRFKRRSLLLNIEPIHGPVQYKEIEKLASWPQLKWIIIGAETGNRKGRVIPKYEWYQNVIKVAEDKCVPIFIKESLREYTPPNQMYKQRPKLEMEELCT